MPILGLEKYLSISKLIVNYILKVITAYTSSHEGLEILLAAIHFDAPVPLLIIRSSVSNVSGSSLIKLKVH